MPKTSDPSQRGCACMEKCSGRCGYRVRIEIAQDRVKEQLPEDEHDYTAAWIYRTTLELADGH